MTWEPISEASLWDMLNSEESRMRLPHLRLWEAIRIPPEKWVQDPFGSEGGGFWVVGILGELVVWFNDIEDGFNYSKYSKFGVIDEYWCNQDSLESTLQVLLVNIQTGQLTGSRAGPPEPIA